MTLDFVQQIIKFVGGKFCDSSVDHENNENCHPTKITRYTVFCGFFWNHFCVQIILVEAKCVVTGGTVSSVVTGGTVSKWGDMCGRM